MKKHKHYSVVKSERDHYLIHDERDNTTFKVAKRPLSAKGHHYVRGIKQYAHGGKVKGYADGGAVEEPVDESAAYRANFMKDVQPIVDAVVPSGLMKGLGDTFGALVPSFGSSEPEPMPLQTQQGPMLAQLDQPVNQPVPDAGQPAMAEQAPAAPVAPQPAPYDPMQQMGNVYDRQKSAVMSQAQAEAAQQQEQAKVYEQANRLMQEHQAIYNQKNAEYDNVTKQLSGEVASGKVNPDRLWQNKSLGSKIRTGIGVMLGGIGAGLQGAGAKNTVLENVMKQIEQDIELQKQDLGRKESLLATNLKAQGNLRDAEQVTRLQYATVLQGQLAKAAAQTNSPIIMERAKLLGAQIDEERQKNMATLATSKANQAMIAPVMEGIKNGQIGLEQALNFIPDKDRVAATKEIEGINEYKAAMQDAAKLYKEASQLSPVSAAMPFDVTDASAKLSRINANLEQVARQSLKGQGTIQESEIKRLIEPYTVSAKDIALEGRVAQKMQDFQANLRKKVASGTPILSRYNIPVNLDTVSTQARQNPMEGKTASDASGRKIIMKNGKWIPYGS